VSLTPTDWIALGLIALTAFSGFRRGLVASALSLGGLVAGAYAGSRVAPHLLHGGAGSAWTPLAGLGGAVVGALLLQTVAGLLGSFLRGGLKLTPFRFFDSLGGIVLGAATGIALVWVVGATALLVPGQTRLRREVQRSTIVRRLDEQVPPSRLLGLLARIDPFPSITGPAAPKSPPSPVILRRSAVLRAKASVVRITGNACGIGIEGSGWFATPRLVVTAAHVVAGEHDTSVQIPGSARPVPRRRPRVRRAQRRRRAPRPRSCAGDAAPDHRRAAGRARRDPRVSGERAADGDSRTDRPHRGPS